MKSNKELTEKDILLEISRKLDYLIAGISVVGKPKSDQILQLKDNFSSYDLSKILNIPAKTIQGTIKRNK